METLINKLIKIEYECFSKTQNIGGRAKCQDNYDKFYIMRKAQWQSLTSSVITSVIEDITKAINDGRNPVSEKYGYMMATYAKDDYDRIKDQLPAISDDKKSIIESIVNRYIRWYEELVTKYPKMMNNGRYLRTVTDSYCSISIETYLRCELMTYSIHTLLLWQECIDSIDYNPVEIIYDYTARSYGYKNSLELENNL